MRLLTELARLAVSPVRALALVLAASVIVLGSALASQYIGGLRPCILCLYQRVPYAAVIALTALALLAPAVGRPLRPALVRRILALCAVIFLVGAGIAAFHVGVEQGWWTGTETCSGPDLNAMSPSQLRAHLMQAPIVRCDEVAWALFGISMAGYNVLVSLVLAAGSAGLARALAGRS